MLPNPQAYFAHLPEPRSSTRNKLHKLIDILMLVLCAVLSGCEDWQSIEDFGHENQEWFKSFLELPNGIPSQDTLSRVIGRIDREAFAELFSTWVREALPSLAEKQIAIDGKSLRNSRTTDGLVHLLTAFASEYRLVLATQVVPTKANENTAIPDLLSQLQLTGAIVTMDAMGCQKSVAKAVINRKADYVLALKRNHATLYDDVKLWLDSNAEKGYVQEYKVSEKNHGRLETQRTVVNTDLNWLPQKEQWQGLKAVARVESVRKTKTKSPRERRYYLCSITEVSRIAQTIRNHWAIENQQHWILDVQFSEEAHQSRKNHTDANSGIIRRAALNLLQQDRDDPLSIRRRKMRAMSNLTYREKLLWPSRNPAQLGCS